MGADASHPLRKSMMAIFFISFIVMNIWCVWTAQHDFPSIFDKTKFFCKLVVFNGIAAGILISVNKYAALLFVLLNSVVSFFILNWHAYLGTVPTIRALKTTFSNNLAEHISIVEYIDTEILTVCIALLLLQCISIWIFRSTQRQYAKIIIIPLILLACHIGTYSLWHKTPPWKFGAWSLESSIERRGFLITWFAEICDGRDYKIEQTCADTRVRDLPMFPVGDKIIVAQVECLDYILMKYTVRNTPLMPTMNEMARKGVLFKVNGPKKLASPNSDYELLNTRVANHMEVFYTFVPEYPDSVIRFFAEQGFHTSVFTGYPGTFANAREGYRKMGAEHVYFLEELQNRGLQPDLGGVQRGRIWIDDRLLLPFTGNTLPASRFFSMLITMNMHDPTDVILPEFAGERHAGSLTVIRETDDAFRALLDVIPDGTLLVVIGDHTAYSGPCSGHIPCLFYRKGEDLSALNGLIQADTVYTRCEMSQYMRRLFGMPKVSAHIPIAADPRE